MRLDICLLRARTDAADEGTHARQCCLCNMSCDQQTLVSIVRIINTALIVVCGTLAGQLFVTYLETT